MRASFGDAPVVEHDDEVGVTDRRDPVRHDQARAAAAHLAEAMKNLVFRIGVDGGERVVEDQHAGIGHQCACQGGALFLPARQRDAALAHQRVVPVGEVAEVLVESSQPGGLFHRQAPRLHRQTSHLWRKSDVGLERVRKEERLLRRHADGGA